MSQHPDDNDVEIDSVVKATDARIRTEALRQLASIDLDDDHARMEPIIDVHTLRMHGHENVSVDLR